MKTYTAFIQLGATKGGKLPIGEIEISGDHHHMLADAANYLIREYGGVDCPNRNLIVGWEIEGTETGLVIRHSYDSRF